MQYNNNDNCAKAQKHIIICVCFFLSFVGVTVRLRLINCQRLMPKRVGCRYMRKRARKNVINMMENEREKGNEECVLREMKYVKSIEFTFHFERTQAND